jgi:hypothetical protein
MKEPNAPTWKDDIERALHEIGRPATVSEIFSLIREIRTLEKRQIKIHSRHEVRRILQSDFVVKPNNKEAGSRHNGPLYWFD